jgi:hypothetical protein
MRNPKGKKCLPRGSVSARINGKDELLLDGHATMNPTMMTVYDFA